MISLNKPLIAKSLIASALSFLDDIVATEYLIPIYLNSISLSLPHVFMRFNFHASQYRTGFSNCEKKLILKSSLVSEKIYLKMRNKHSFHGRKKKTIFIISILDWHQNFYIHKKNYLDYFN